MFGSVFGAAELMMRAWSNGDTPVSMDMTSIGAMSTIRVNSQTSYKIFFTEDGKQFRIWNENDAAVSKLYSL